LDNLNKNIRYSIDKFSLQLNGLNILTEAATGNYAVTPVIAACAGANVFALAKDSHYGSIEEISNQIKRLAKSLNVSDKIRIIFSYDDVDLSLIDILTNTGFNRPIDKRIINKLSGKCVIPLMMEPWEYRSSDVDIDACIKKGIKVYGTDECSSLVQTFKYLGYLVLYKLLNNGVSPLSCNKICLIGSEIFVHNVYELLRSNNYDVTCVTDYKEKIQEDQYNCFVLLEQHRPIRLLGGRDSFLRHGNLIDGCIIIHISGNVGNSSRFKKIRLIPETPRKFGFMSFTCDLIDSNALIDLQSAGFKVAEGMLSANERGLIGEKYKKFMESNYPAKAFSNPCYY